MPDNYEASVLADKKSVSVTIAADTKLSKHSFSSPRRKIEKTGGWYKADDLKREVSAGQ